VIILDTNVVSELMRHDANPAVQAWARRRRRRDLITTAVMELSFASTFQRRWLLPDGTRRAAGSDEP
jgi:predicted nucleic acid-binding protein